MGMPLCSAPTLFHEFVGLEHCDAEVLQRFNEERVRGLKFSFEPADIVNTVMSFGSPTPIEVVVNSPHYADNLVLAEKVKKGSVGVWGQIPMPPNAQVSDADIKTLVGWILTLKK